jgi:hypothetical protein
MPRLLSTRRLLISAIAISLLGVGALALFGQERIPPAAPPSTLQPTTSSSAAEAAALLPSIPPEVPQFHPVVPGEMPPQHQVTFGIIPNGPAPNPDEDKYLYGYSGPYYNTTNLDGRVVVLDQTLYIWPTATWKSSGMLRNQTRSDIHITGISARLLGSRGNLLATASAAAPVADLRPGEPGPFMIEAPVAASAIASIDWHVDYVTSQDIPRKFTFSVYADQSSAGYGYYLFGRVSNAAAASSPTRIVAAWLNYDGYGRVLYVDSPQISVVSPARELADYRATVTLTGGESENFVYRTKNPDLVSIMDKGKLVLWGTSK